MKELMYISHIYMYHSNQSSAIYPPFDMMSPAIRLLSIPNTPQVFASMVGERVCFSALVPFVKCYLVPFVVLLHVSQLCPINGCSVVFLILLPVLIIAVIGPEWKRKHLCHC